MSINKSEESKPRPLLGIAVFISTMGVIATLTVVDTFDSNSLEGGKVALAGLVAMFIIALVGNFSMLRREQTATLQAEHQPA